MSFQQSFLAVGTKVVVQKGENRPFWYETKKEVIIEGEPGQAICPITKKSVRFVYNEGFRIYYPANIARNREVMEEGDLNQDTLGNMRPCLFVYDIPDASEFPNPSGILRSIGARINLSGWLINEADTPHALIARMLDAGCNPHIFRFEASEAKRLVSLAVATLKKEVLDATKRAEKSMRDAETKLTDPNDSRTNEARQEWYLQRAEAIRDRLAEFKTDLAEVSKRFGLAPEVLRVERLSAAGDAIKSGMEARARAYLISAKALVETGDRDAVALGKAMMEDKAIPQPAADMLREHGMDEAADALQTAFDDNADADGVFSLVGSDAE